MGRITASGGPPAGHRSARPSTLGIHRDGLQPGEPRRPARRARHAQRTRRPVGPRRQLVGLRRMGEFAQIYVRHGTLTSPPALEVVLAPVLVLGQAIGTSLHTRGPARAARHVVGARSRRPPARPRPRCSPSMRSHASGVSRRAPGWPSPSSARSPWPTSPAYWGHPEDCVALAFVVWAAWPRAGAPGTGGGAAGRAGCSASAIAFQPLAILGVAPVLTRLGWKAAARSWWRLVLPSLVGPRRAASSASPDGPSSCIVHQPFLPRLRLLHAAHPPGTRPRPRRGRWWADPARRHRDFGMPRRGRLSQTSRPGHRAHLGGRRGLHDPRSSSRAELNWYYLWPVPALCLLLSVRRSPTRFWLCHAPPSSSAWCWGTTTPSATSALWWPGLDGHARGHAPLPSAPLRAGCGRAGHRRPPPVPRGALPSGAHPGGAVGSGRGGAVGCGRGGTVGCGRGGTVGCGRAA